MLAPLLNALYILAAAVQSYQEKRRLTFDPERLEVLPLGPLRSSTGDRPRRARVAVSGNDTSPWTIDERGADGGRVFSTNSVPEVAEDT